MPILIQIAIPLFSMDCLWICNEFLVNFFGADFNIDYICFVHELLHHGRHRLLAGARRVDL